MSSEYDESRHEIYWFAYEPLMGASVPTYHQEYTEVRTSRGGETVFLMCDFVT